MGKKPGGKIPGGETNREKYGGKSSMGLVPVTCGAYRGSISVTSPSANDWLTQSVSD